MYQQRGLDYQYGGQWFDDMGSLALSFMDAPSVGIDLANNPLSRDQTNSMAKYMMNSGVPAYDEETPPVGV